MSVLCAVAHFTRYACFYKATSKEMRQRKKKTGERGEEPGEGREKTGKDPEEDRGRNGEETGKSRRNIE